MKQKSFYTKKNSRDPDSHESVTALRSTGQGADDFIIKRIFCKDVRYNCVCVCKGYLSGPVQDGDKTVTGIKSSGGISLFTRGFNSYANKTQNFQYYNR